MSTPDASPAACSAVPCNPPSAQDWANYKEVITHLYRENTLHDVQRFMEELYSFKATERMYRTRIKSWRLDKKIKDREARAVVCIVRQRRNAGLPPPRFTLRGKELSLADALRYLKRKGLSYYDVECSHGTQPEIPPDLNVITQDDIDIDIDTTSLAPPHQHPLSVFACDEVSRTLSTPPDIWYSQYLISQVSNYFDSSLALPTPPASDALSTPNIMSPWEVFNLYLCGAGLAARNDPTGWPLMTHALELLETVIQHQDPWLLPQIFDLHLRAEVTATLRPERAREFLSLLQGWADALLGPTHPVALVCAAITARSLDTRARVHADMAIAAAFARTRGPSDHYTRSARVALCRTLHQLGRLDAARAAWCALITELEACGDADDVWVRACLLGLAATDVRRGDVGNVHCVLHNFVERMLDALCPLGGDDDDEELVRGVPAEQSIACVIDCVRRSQIRIGEAEQLIRVAMGLITARGVGHERCRSLRFAAIMRDIDRNWNTQGKFDAIKSLKMYYGSMIERARLNSGLGDVKQ